jgi:glucose-6-phosphate 1-dehydrogenase
MTKPSAPASLVLFGATGDLAQRMLIPSLYHLSRDGLLDPAMRILAASRTEMSTEAFLHAQRDNLKENRATKDYFNEDDFAAFAKRVTYAGLDAGNAQALCDTLHRTGLADAPARVYYLSTSPKLYGPIAKALGDGGLICEGSRVVMEKPIGFDLATSREINSAIAKVFEERQVFRIDHYLGKETVLNLLALRFGNAIFEPLWTARTIEHVQITVAETVGLESRAGYYDTAGALRDMVQNHILQLLCLIAMEPPARYEPDAVRNEKIKVLKSLHLLSREDVAEKTAIGQYAKSAAGAGYLDELGGKSDTETFVAIKAEIDNWRWKGAPFYIRTGKRAPQRYSEIVIQFRDVPHSIFGDGASLKPNKLVIRLQPDENVRLYMMAKQPGLTRDGIRLQEFDLGITQPDESRRRIAYERLILDALEGDQTLFVRRDEVEAAWEWIDSIRAGWEQVGMKPKSYPAGQFGPTSGIGLIERDERSWHE